MAASTLSNFENINNAMMPEPQLPSPCSTPTRDLPTNNNNARRLNIATVVIGANVAIEVQDEFTAVDCEVYSDSHWMGLDLALPRQQEVMTRENLLTLIRGLWPAIDTTSFKLKLVKSFYLDPDDIASICYSGGGGSSGNCNIGQGCPLTPFEPQRFCQAVLGVREEESAGIAIYGDIVLGPRIPYDEANAKRPEHEHESLAVAVMVKGLLGALSRLTQWERTRLAEQTYEGSSNVSAVKKVKTEGGDWGQAILID